MKLAIAVLLTILTVHTFQPTETFYVKHTMKDGETLWNVVSDVVTEQKDCRTVGEVVDETRTLNDLQGNKLANLESGKIIVIPCKRNKWF